MFLFVWKAAQSTPIMGLLFSTNHNSLQVCSGNPKVRFMQKAHVDFCFFLWHSKQYESFINTVLVVSLSSADFSDCCCVCTEKKDVKKCSACKMVSGRYIYIYKVSLKASFHSGCFYETVLSNPYVRRESHVTG